VPSSATAVTTPPSAIVERAPMRRTMRPATALTTM
jgi:hypothetical protein